MMPSNGVVVVDAVGGGVALVVLAVVRAASAAR
jgi:hypothetical protein